MKKNYVHLPSFFFSLFFSWDIILTLLTTEVDHVDHNNHNDEDSNSETTNMETCFCIHPFNPRNINTPIIQAQTNPTILNLESTHRP